MSKHFIAELHDIGKLVDSRSFSDDLQISGHTYHNFDFSKLNISPPTSPSWWGQLHHSIKDLSSRKLSGVPDNIKACVLLTVISDRLAASVSRSCGEKGNVEEGIYLLWNPHYYQQRKQNGQRWAAFATVEELKEMFVFIDSCTNKEEFFEKYTGPLSLTPEDKSVPLNFISLKTHLELTGKVFRVLRSHSQLIIDNDKSYLEYDSQRISQLTEATGGRWNENQKGKWIFRLVKCRVKFPQAIVRLHDLNVIKLRQHLIQKIIDKQNIANDDERQPYAVLFNSDDFFCIFVPKENIVSLENILQPLTDKGFWIECEELETELNLITSTGARTRKQLRDKNNGTYGNRKFHLQNKAVWPSLPESIDISLCDICQQRHGKEYIKEDIKESLCDVCKEIRDMGEPLQEYAEWAETGKQSAWFKVSLDEELLLGSLERLFGEHVDSINNIVAEDKQALKEGFRPLAAQMEFVKQYKQFLEDFQSKIKNIKISDGISLIEGINLLFPIDGYYEMAVVRIDDERILGLILDVFAKLLRTYFPECIKDSPISISVSLSNPKYPYHEHWRYFSISKSSGTVLNIQQAGIRSVDLTFKQYAALRSRLKGIALSHSLHRLASIESETGGMTALIQFLEDRRKNPELNELLEQYGLTLRQILDFYRIIGTDNKDKEYVRS